MRNDQGALQRAKPLNHLAITVTLQYIRNRAKYNRLRAFLISQITEILSDREVYFRQDTEMVILFLDSITCPYIDDPTKAALASVFGLDTVQLASLTAVSSNWFTSWSGFSLSKELDAKRYRDVY